MAAPMAVPCLETMVGGDVVRKRAGDDVIGGDRKLHIGIAGEYDQSDFILMKLFDQPVDREFGAFESIRFEILRQHAVSIRRPPASFRSPCA